MKFYQNSLIRLPHLLQNMFQNSNYPPSTFRDATITNQMKTGYHTLLSTYTASSHQAASISSPRPQRLLADELFFALSLMEIRGGLAITVKHILMFPPIIDPNAYEPIYSEAYWSRFQE